MYQQLMTFFIIISNVVTAPPAPDDVQARIIKYENSNDGNGNYEFSFETSNGLTRHETGQFVNVGEPNAHIVVQGEYSYIDPDGKVQFVRYTADENGYQIFLEQPPELSTQAPQISSFAEALPGAAVATLLG